MKFYAANKILSMLDADGKRPQMLYIVGNRTGGKSFAIKCLLLRKFMKRGEKFVVFVRFKEDIKDAVRGFFADIGPIKFPGHNMSQRPLLNGKAAELFLDSSPCGYVVALNDSQVIKRNSALFSDACWGFMDEFQNEDGRYVPDEVRKYNTIRTSIARGGAKGSYTRVFTTIFVSNAVTSFNPYYDYYGIARSITNRAHYIRGHGWVLEIYYNKEAADAVRRNSTGMSEREIAYATSNKPLMDVDTFVDSVPGNRRCVLGLKYNGRVYGVWLTELGYTYVCRQYDTSARGIITTSNEDHTPSTVLMSPASGTCKMLRNWYNNGYVCFESMAARIAFIECMRIK